MHQTVLLQEAVDALVTNPGGFYVDGTFGRGGHTRCLLDRLDGGARVLAVDKDEAAETVARALQRSEPRFEFFRGSFAQLPHQLRRMGIDAVDGILLDLGVSSPQLDEAERGFSFMQDGPLDMRMDTSRGETAAQWLSHAELADIAGVLKEYGEERFARRIATAIVAAREEAPIETTSHLASVVSAAHPRWEKHKHPATRSFQAIRIKVNSELDDLQEFLSLALDMLRVGGRLVVISFHSLEDRRIKRYMRDKARGDDLPRGVPVTEGALNKRMRLVGRAVRASEAEVQANVRARSAVMRVAEKIG
ncbi:16S rRNA (cytosine(1402)-N(4))-methyltransferase RsmH [Candidatus Marimicrobium litorale]|nr:16S rRNA (cytosine(1402)-N(4))-methyltransferase RsmH [Candidatus Marimicrobium litorale]